MPRSEKNTLKKSKGGVRFAEGKQPTYTTKAKEEKTYVYHPLSWRYAALVTQE